jgi:hypothetical protein
MKRIWMNVGVTVGTTLIAGAIVASCAHNDASIFVRQVFLPSIPSNGECSYTADVSQASESTGMADVSFANLSTYTPEVLVGNQILQQANANQLQAETSRVIVNGAITRITDLDGNTSLLPMLLKMYAAGDLAAQATGKALQAGTITTPINPFSTVESTAIEPGSGTSPSYAVMSLTMVDSATVGVLRYYFTQALQLNGAAAFTTSIQLLTYTKVEGTTLGGDPVESNEFEFPVTFTYGGLVANLASDPTSAVGYCLYPEVLPTSAQTCVPGQDVAIIVSALQGVSRCLVSTDAGVIADAGQGGGDI